MLHITSGCFQRGALHPRLRLGPFARTAESSLWSPSQDLQCYLGTRISDLVHECCSNSFKAIYTHDSVRLLDLLLSRHRLVEVLDNPIIDTEHEKEMGAVF
mmetsp:Transcript_21507/g.45061  ORF Transcript_21507/g.45061 Transcript_21507/m.45061 type:complete len:101 (-) Transcript_21507:490-792(-)